jgi:hypothetical protein
VYLPWSRLGSDRAGQHASPPGALLTGQAQAHKREAITGSRQGKLTALLHHIDVAVLRASFFGLKKSAALGVDQMTLAKFAETLEANLVDLGGWRIWAALRFGRSRSRAAKLAARRSRGDRKAGVSAHSDCDRSQCASVENDQVLSWLADIGAVGADRERHRAQGQ